jgi:enoyl-CoA hydratase
MEQFETVTLARTGAVGELRLSRPELHNRFDSAAFRDLLPALAELGRDAEVKAVVLSAEGKHFSAGGDMQMMLTANADLQVLMAQVDEGRQLFRAFADFPKPLVAAVHGHVFGVATSLVLTADAVVSTSGVRIVDPHVHMGLVAGDGGCVTWPANLPLVRAKRHLLWGEPILAEEAYRFGMVTDLAESADGVRPLAIELAEQVAGLPPVAVQLTKRALNKQLGARIDDVLDTAFYLEAISASTADVREAVAAFQEKRPGVWSGR